jgi:hypothetical protein
MMGWVVIALIIAAIVGIGLLALSLHKRRDLTLSEAATYIENFANGAGQAWDWDDFTSEPHTDPAITHIVKECEQVEINFPPRHEHEWCNPDGIKELKQIAERVRKKAQPAGGADGWLQMNKDRTN